MVELLYKEEVYAIVGAAIEVHRQLNSGFYEAVYHEAMEIELGSRGIPFRSLVPLKVLYKGAPLKKEYIADLVCYEQIIVELKVMKELTGREEQQVLHYLKATGLRLGLLINFGDAGRLDWKRLIR